MRPLLKTTFSVIIHLLSKKVGLWPSTPPAISCTRLLSSPRPSSISPLLRRRTARRARAAAAADRCAQQSSSCQQRLSHACLRDLLGGCHADSGYRRGLHILKRICLTLCLRFRTSQIIKQHVSSHQEGHTPSPSFLCQFPLLH